MSELPPAGWPGWAARAASLRAYLKTPRGRTWAELRAWAKEEGVGGFELLNRLAALEYLGVVFSIGEGKRVRWVALQEGQNRPQRDVITSPPEQVPEGRRRVRERPPEPRRYTIASR
ncbi:MAG: hypothetical protein MUF64_11155 [Polyangiaceae bacterium]|nr:hypothetical protein [Polyangiaceae bacterium]